MGLIKYFVLKIFYVYLLSSKQNFLSPDKYTMAAKYIWS